MDMWIVLLSNMTEFPDKDDNPNLTLCADAWSLFEPVTDILPEIFAKGNEFQYDFLILLFFSNLSSIPSQTIEVYEQCEGFLDPWFELYQRKQSKWGIEFWSRLITNFSSVPSLVPKLSSKFDAKMKWCKLNGKMCATSVHYCCYLAHCSSSEISNKIQPWNKLLKEIIYKCPNSQSISTLYNNYKGRIKALFQSLKTNSQIESNQTEIFYCCQCLSCFLQPSIFRKYPHKVQSQVLLPEDDYNDLFDTFIDDISRFGTVLPGSLIDHEFCILCWRYSQNHFHSCEHFFGKIHSNLSRIFIEIVTGKLIGENIEQFIVRILNLAVFLLDISTKSSILSLFQPFVAKFFRRFDNIFIQKGLINMLYFMTLSSNYGPPNARLASEAWPLFSVVMRTFRRHHRDFTHYNVFGFFANLCCDSARIPEIYTNVKDVLIPWYEYHKDKDYVHSCSQWFRLISMLSSDPSIIPFLSPKFDDSMKWIWDNKATQQPDYDRYVSNVAAYVSRKFFIPLISSVPMVSMIPVLETSISPDSGEYEYVSRICSVMEFTKSLKGTHFFLDFSLVNVITGVAIQHKTKICVRGQICCEIPKKQRDAEESCKPDESKLFIEKDSINHSSLMLYTAPRHMTISMPVEDERHLRQSVYDSIEQSGAGVEVLFLG
ncbi:hypothetical protein ADUPG1_009883 [Aduncisulcus paluster]|uniref:Uncharacterized protein n=2 Tax=Aduncisulcus paluster TaxID=2918883 RepID=A0ABQ5KZT3_9EUKA|nr:hypothetical protein ADUPG1_009883 [Aduncisulcus paluster]